MFYKKSFIFDQINELTRSCQEKEVLKNILDKYFEVFSKNKLDIGCYNGVKHQIETGTKGPVVIPPRRIPMAAEDKVEEHIKELLKQKIIRYSNSPWNAPLVIAQKPNGDIRMCVDYRKLNSITEKPVFTIPDSTYLFDQLDGCEYFSTIDLSQGYYQVPVAEKDSSKTAFTTKSGHYEFLKLPFGLSGAPACFQKVMSEILSTINWRGCLIYLDDILFFSRSLEEHKEKRLQVLESIKVAGFKLAPKMFFSQTGA